GQMMMGGNWVVSPDVPGNPMAGALIWQPPAPGEAPGGFIGQNWLPAAQSMFNMGDASNIQAQKLWSLEDPIIEQGMDPQNALYGRTAQQLQDQTRAGLAARGILMDPYGAGVEGSTMSNFNIDWQNNQLQRRIAAAQAAGGLS